MRRLAIRRTIALGLALSAAMGGTMPASAAWSSSTIDGQWLFTRPSLAVDGADHTGIASQRVGLSPSIVYSTNATGSWVTGTVTTGNVSGPSLRFDSANHPVLAFSRLDGTKGVYVTSKTTGSWVAPLLVASDADPQSPSLALNASNKRGVAWGSTYSFAPGLYFATDASGAWIKTRVTTGPWDMGASLQFDAAGKAHLVFTRHAPDAPGIYYATNATGSWVTKRITTGFDDGARLAMDGAGKAHVAYRTADSGGVYYATNKTGTWVSTLLPYADETDFGAPAIALDSTDAPHVAFSTYRRSWVVPTRGWMIEYYLVPEGWTTRWHDEYNADRSDDLPTLGFLSDDTRQLAFRRIYPETAIELAGGGGGLPTVIAAAHLDGGPSIALGPSGERLVSFNRRDGAGGAAILATNSGGGWSLETAGTGNTAQAGTDIAVDTSGDARLADGANIYSNAAGSWLAGPALPEYSETEVAVDGSLHTHAVVSYYSLNVPVQQWFQYWTNATGSWVGEDTIPKQSWVGFYGDPQPDIALDAAGKPHVVFTAPQGPCCGQGYDSNLFYQNKVSGTWSAPANVYLGGIRANWPSIAIDAAGKVHIAYERYTDSYNQDPAPGIYYATNASGSWVSKRLTRSYGDGAPSIALDAGGRVYIATTRATWAAHPGVYVMTNATGSWVVSRVYSGAAVDASIAVTSAGLARLVFDTDTAIVYWENSTSTLIAALAADSGSALDLGPSVRTMDWGAGTEEPSSGGLLLGGDGLSPDSGATHTIPGARPGH